MQYILFLPFNLVIKLKEVIIILLKLNERIGIDRTIIDGFELKTVNMEKLKYQEQQGAKISLKCNENSPMRLNDTGLQELTIEDNFIGEFSLRCDLNGITGEYKINNTLAPMVSPKNNLQNLNAEEYKKRIADIFEYIYTKYGVEVDTSNIKIKRLEINTTFRLKEPYANYRRAILYLVQNIQRYNGKCAMWFDCNNNQKNLETILLKNTCTEMKIYNKGKHLKDIGKLEESSDDDYNNIMRIEYTIKDKRLLNSDKFGGNSVNTLTDKVITDFFKQNFKRDILLPYRELVKNNTEQLYQKMMKHKAKSRYWVDKFLRDCRAYEHKNNAPLLFDLDDMRNVFLLETGDKKIANEKLKNFKKSAKYEYDLMGHSKKIAEIISKVENM